MVPDLQQIGVRIHCFQQLFRRLVRVAHPFRCAESRSSGRDQTSPAYEHGPHLGSRFARPELLAVIQNTAACVAAPQPYAAACQARQNLYLRSPRRARQPHAFDARSRQIERFRIALIPPAPASRPSSFPAFAEKSSAECRPEQIKRDLQWRAAQPQHQQTPVCFYKGYRAQCLRAQRAPLHQSCLPRF